jgi:hypothetical protein
MSTPSRETLHVLLRDLLHEPDTSRMAVLIKQVSEILKQEDSELRLLNRKDPGEFPIVPLVHAIPITNVVANDPEYAAELARLRTTAAESRLRAAECQLALVFTLCAIAETEIRYGRPDEAMKVVKKVRHHAETIRIHLDEPNHRPSTAISDLRLQLTQLKERTNEIELRLASR